MGALVREVAVTWFREEDYPSLLEPPRRCPTHGKSGSSGKNKWKNAPGSKGCNTVRVYIDPESFADGVCVKEKAPIVTAAKGSL
jgi:hypothetical protein